MQVRISISVIKLYKNTTLEVPYLTSKLQFKSSCEWHCLRLRAKDSENVLTSDRKKLTKIISIISQIIKLIQGYGLKCPL